MNAMILFVAGGVRGYIVIIKVKCVKWFTYPCSTHTKLTTNSEWTLNPTIAYITLV